MKIIITEIFFACFFMLVGAMARETYLDWQPKPPKHCIERGPDYFKCEENK
jgi:hypothetical protein